jgi:hypothetical protein
MACTYCGIVVQGGGVSIWHAQGDGLKHCLCAYHELQPPVQSDALGLHASVLALAAVSLPCAPPQDGSSRSAEQQELALVVVMSNGQFWRWVVPLPDMPAADKEGGEADEYSNTSRALTRGTLPLQTVHLPFILTFKRTTLAHL